MGFVADFLGLTPDTPDYTGAALAQAQAGKELTTDQTFANRPTMITPWGTQTWNTSAGIDPATGQPVTNWTGQLSLNPMDQAALDAQRQVQLGRSQGAQTLLGQSIANFQAPTNWNNLPSSALSFNQGATQQFSPVQTPGVSAPARAPAPAQQSSIGGGKFGPVPAPSTGSKDKFGQAPSSAPSAQSQTNVPSATAFTRNAQPTLTAPQTGTVAPGSTAGIQSRLAPSTGIQNDLSATAGDWRQRGQQAALDFMRPQQQQRQSDLESQLANMGLTRGSEAWNREMQRNSDQTTRDELQAFDSGRQEANMLFGQDLASGQFHNAAQQQGFGQNLSAGQFANSAQQQGFGQQMSLANLGDQRAQQAQNMLIQQGSFNNQNRQQAISEEMQRRSQTLNELNALLTGQQVSQPQMPQFNTAGVSQAPNLLGAMTQGYQADLNTSNAGNAFVGDLAKGVMGAMAFSDARLKEDIVTVGALPSGLRVVQFRYKGTAPIFLGVIAQEAQEIFPHSVVRHPNGYLMVNYAEIH